MRSISLKPSVLAGIAIQPENIHLVQLKKTRKEYQIEKIRRYTLSAEVFAEGKITSFGMLQKRLAEVVELEGLNDTRAAVCVTANQVRMQTMTVPAGLSEIDIESEIRILMQRALPVKNDALAIDFHLSDAENVNEKKVFFAAARHEYIHQIQTCVGTAGFKITMVDIDVFALMRAARYALRDIWLESESICALYVGSQYAVMAAQYGDEMLFHQQWDGGCQATHAMTCWQWLEWSCHTWRHLGIGSVAIGGSPEAVYQAAVIIAANWQCKIYEPDPFQKMSGASAIDKSVMNDSPSAFLLACGLAMRKVCSW